MSIYLPERTKQEITPIARVQSHSDFRSIREWMKGPLDSHLGQKIRVTRDNAEIHRIQGRMEMLSDLEELFTNAHDEWASKK